MARTKPVAAISHCELAVTTQRRFYCAAEKSPQGKAAAMATRGGRYAPA